VTTLVTGGTGFVGSAVARHLLAAGHEVRVMARDSSLRAPLADLDVQWVRGDLVSQEGLAAAVAGCRYVFHVAADYRLWVPEPAPMYRANVEGTEALMRAAGAAGVERIVYTSSVATLGHNPNGVADEDTPVTLASRIGHYKRSKFLGQQRVLALVDELSLPVVIVNPSTPIGPGDVKPTPTGRIIVDAARGRIPAFVDTGLNVVHVDDVAAGHLLALKAGRIGQKYILGGTDMTLAQILAEVAKLRGRPAPTLRLPRAPLVPLAHIAEALARLTGKPPRFSRDELRMAAQPMYFSSAKAMKELDYEYRAPQLAISDAVRWFEQNGYL
jgi:dihydroflavonol-4-reductase